jgi:hypothetical protein
VSFEKEIWLTELLNYVAAAVSAYVTYNQCDYVL